jgi:hypothetical protein
MKRFRMAGLLAAWAVLAMSGCGVPREAGALAHAAAASTQPADPAHPDAARAALLAERTRWNRLESLVYQQEFLGLWGVDDRFRALVSRVASLARRQAALIEQNLDDPAQNTAALRSFDALWQDADRYLNP